MQAWTENGRHKNNVCKIISYGAASPFPPFPLRGGEFFFSDATPRNEISLDWQVSFRGVLWGILYSEVKKNIAKLWGIPYSEVKKNLA